MNKAENATTMSKEAREARNAYHREWNAKNRDKIREYGRRRWEKKAQEAMKELEVIKEKKDGDLFGGMEIKIKRAEGLPERRLQRKGIKYKITDLSRINPATYKMLIEIIDLIRDGRVEEGDAIKFEIAPQDREDDAFEIACQLTDIMFSRTDKKNDISSAGHFISTGVEMFNRTVTIHLVEESIKPITEYCEQTRMSTIEELTDLMIYVANEQAERKENK